MMNWEIVGYIFAGTVGLFVGCFFIALAVEEWNKHKREKEEREYWEGRTHSLTKHR